MTKVYRNQKGTALGLVLILIIVISIMGYAFLSNSNNDLRVSGNSSKTTDASYIADSGVNRIIKNLKGMAGQYRTIDFLHPRPMNSSTPPAPIPLIEVTPSGSYDRSTFITQCEGINSAAPNPHAACDYLADLTELRVGLGQAIDPDHNVELLSIDRHIAGTDLSEPWNRALADGFKVPLSVSTAYADLNAEVRIYGAIVRATSLRGNAISTKEVRFIIYSIPLFQWLVLADDCITSSPMSASEKGRKHSNTCIRMTSMNSHKLSPLNFNPGSMVATTAGKIWRMSRIRNYIYNDPTDPGVQVEESSGSWVKLVDHLVDDSEDWLAYNEINETSYLDHEDFLTAINATSLWKEIGSDGYAYYSQEVKASDPAFNNRLADKTTEIKPAFYDTLLNKEKYKLIDIIQPPNINSKDELDSSYLIGVKKVYNSDIRIVNGISLDAIGNPLPSTSPYHYDNLVDVTKGVVIQREVNAFYNPIHGRAANVTKIDIGVLKSRFPEVRQIYVGSTHPTEGEIQFPTPGCTGSTVGGGAHPPICVTGTGTDCTTTCDKNNIGSYETIMLTNGAELPNGGLTVYTNTAGVIQGNYNNTNPKPAAFYSDTIQYLSNSWDPSGWHFDKDHDVTGPKSGSQTEYNLAIMSGQELSLIENWSGYLIKNVSQIFLWKPSHYPPRAESVVIGDPKLRALDGYYSPASWDVDQNVTFGLYPPPGDEYTILIQVQSYRDIENPS